MPQIALRSSVIAFALLFATAVLPAQESADPGSGGGIPIESEWDGYSPSLYNRGDQTFVINLGSVVPLFFVSGSGDSMANNATVGGAGSLNYNYYFSPSFAVGGEFGGMFSGTIGENMLFIMPFGVKATYQFVKTPFEFPLSLMIGGASQSYLDTDYFGLIVKPGAAAYWRYSPDWSFGLNAVYWWVPQWTNDEDTTAYGNFLELTLSARYHF